MKLSEEFICRQVCGEMLLMPVGEKTKEYNGIFTLSDSGAFLLNEILNGADVAAAARALASEFEIGEAEALADTQEFVDQLFESGIIVN